MTPAQEKAFAARLKQRFGLTMREYRDIWVGQQGKCPICGKALKHSGRGGACVDHDHHVKTKKGERKAVRGILCGFYCNRFVLGSLERAGKTRVWNALAYLGWI